ncbi:MAG: hypothetical protein ABJB22_05830 [Verrucomicrobiota bacterium]
MNTALKYTLAAIVVLFLSAAGLVLAQSDAPYTEGSVWAVTMVKTKAGMSDDYLKNLNNAYRKVMEDAKKENVIMDYKILVGDAASPNDFDILLMVEYKNMAAMDTLRDKMDPLEKKVLGSEDQRRQATTKRGEIREILGAKTMREVTLK